MIKASVGSIVEFMQDNYPQIAWVMENQINKVRLLLPNRRESSMSITRILPWEGPHYPSTKSKEEIIQLLTQHKEKREEIKATINVVALWEMCQGEVAQENPLFFAELMESDPSVDHVAAYAHALLEYKNYFKFTQDHFEIHPENVVQTKLDMEAATKERESLIGGGTEWFHHLWENHLTDTIDFQKEPQEPIQSRLKHILLSRIAVPESQDDDALWKQVSKQLPTDPHLPLLLATAWKLVPEHYNFWLAQADYDPSPNFAHAHQAEWENMVQIVKTIEDISQQKQNSMPQQISKQEQQAPEQNNVADETAQEFTGTKNPLGTCHAQTIVEFFTSVCDEPFISIDSPSTTDIDDAFTISAGEDGGWKIHIALACPACAWQFHSPFDKLIARRSTSLYLPEATYHMMPHALATEAFSLFEKRIRPALIFECHVTNDGSIENVKWSFSQITVQANLHYDACEKILLDALSISQKDALPSDMQAQEFMSHMDITPQIFPLKDAYAPPHPFNDYLPTPHEDCFQKAKTYTSSLLLAYDFAQARLQSRINQGAVIIDKEEIDIHVDEQSTHVELKQIAQNAMAQRIVSELMILANCALADYAIVHNMPLIFRTQDVVIPREYAGIWIKPHEINKVVRLLAAARTESTPKPHAGLGLKAYSPVTSPLRRYSDLINEAQLLHHIITQEFLWNAAELDEIILNLHIHGAATNQVQRMRPRYWRYVFIQQEAKRQGETCGFHAIISDENDMYVTVTLTREQILVRTKRSFFGEKALLGQEVLVRLGKINPLRGEASILAVQEV